MTTLPPSGVKYFPEDSLEKQVYGVVEDLTNYLPIANDRNRMGFSLYKFIQGEGDEPEILVKTLKLTIKGISQEELAKLIKTKIEKIEVQHI